MSNFEISILQPATWFKTFSLDSSLSFANEFYSGHSFSLSLTGLVYCRYILPERMLEIQDNELAALLTIRLVRHYLGVLTSPERYLDGGNTGMCSLSLVRGY